MTSLSSYYVLPFFVSVFCCCFDFKILLYLFSFLSFFVFLYSIFSLIYVGFFNNRHYGNRHFGTVDVMGIHILGIDILGIDILAPTRKINNNYAIKKGW